jgi:hypothetical protein
MPSPRRSIARALTTQNGDHDQDLAGTWTLSGDKVTISPRGPSVLRFTEFTVAPDQLTGERVLSGETLHLVLTRDHSP